MVVRCNHCGLYFFEEDSGTYYTPDTDYYGTNKIMCCPNCGCTELEDIGNDEEDLVDYLNKVNEKERKTWKKN